MKNNKKFIIVIVFVFLSIFGFKVFAETNVVSPEVIKSPMILNINPSGNVLMRGFVESVGTDSIVVKSWGGSWTVKISATTNIISLNRVITDIQSGDFVGISGNITQDGSFVIDANIARKWVSRVDSDKDGISDDQDKDDDNDNIEDSKDSKSKDHDNDDISDDLDIDDDNDGIEDSKDSKSEDHDNDGLIDSQDKDDDNDNIPDVSDSKSLDHDNDGKDDDKDEKDDSLDAIDDNN